MATIWGVVKGGLIVPETPLPEGIRVEIHLPPEAPPELQAELEGWDRASANALDLVEDLAGQADHTAALGDLRRRRGTPPTGTPESVDLLREDRAR
jgi:hypothetical protein